MADDTPQVDLAAELAMAQSALAASNRLLKRASERCRRLEAERNTARADALNEAANAVDALYESAGPNNPLCTEDAYFLGVDHAFAAVRGLPVPETQEPQT